MADGGTRVHAAAAEGVRSGGGRLPHGEQIQRSFGGYDISNVVAHTGAAAEKAAGAMGASAYATGNDVVLGKGGSDLHTVAHEAAHVVQQRAGVSLSGGVGQAGDPYERHADAVADLVVQGKSAEGLLGEMAGGGAPAGAEKVQRGVVQRREPDSSASGGNGASSRAPSPPPESGSITSGGIDVRRIQADQVDDLLHAMQVTASMREGGRGQAGSEPASIRGSGVATMLEMLLQNMTVVRRGYLELPWMDDNGSERFFGAWDYEMRVTIKSIHYLDPSPTGASGTHGSAASTGTTGTATDSRSVANTTTVGLGGEMSDSIPGATSGKSTSSGTLGQTTTTTSSRTDSAAGNETFSRDTASYSRYKAGLRAKYNIAFRPWKTLGIANQSLKSQDFNGSNNFGTIWFDYSEL